MASKLKQIVEDAEKLDLAAELAVAPSEEVAPEKPKKAAKEKVVKRPKNNKLAAIRAVLQKAFKEEGIDEVQVDESQFKESIPHLPTGSVIVDFLIGGLINQFGVQPCPGFPRGKIVNLYGEESSGKTTLCLMLAAETCRRGGVVVYIDWEQAVDVAYAKALGVPIDDPDQFMLLQPPTFEKGLNELWTAVRGGADLVIVDSVASGATQAQWEKSTAESHETGRLGSKAALWSEFLPKLRAAMSKTNTAVVGISQLRANIAIGPAAYGAEKDSAQGGKAWRFYSEVRLRLKRIGYEKGKQYDPLTHTMEEHNIGNIVRVKIDKCKLSAAQGREAQIYIRYGEGIDNLRSIIEVAAARGIVKKAGAWFNWERGDGTMIKQAGLEPFRKEIVNTKGAWTELREMTLASLAKALVDQPKVQAEEEESDLDDSDIDAIIKGDTLKPKEAEEDGES